MFNGVELIIGGLGCTHRYWWWLSGSLRIFCRDPAYRETQCP